MLDFHRQTPDGDNRERSVCGTCGFVAYDNPKVIVGSVVAENGHVLLCRRAIEPRRGYWTLPAGYLENGETVEEGAVREAREEANADIVLDGILAVYSISRIDQVQIIFAARFVQGRGAAPGRENDVRFSAGPESADVRLFPLDEVPESDLAFPSVRWALDAWRLRRGAVLGAPARNPPADPRGDRPIAGQGASAL